MILCTWGLTKYRETTTVVSAVVVVAFLFPRYLFVNYTLFFFSIVSESNQMLILNLTTFNFFFLEQPFLLLPLLQSQKLFNLYLFSLSLLVSLVFCAAHNSTTYKYDGVHSILAINISRVCLSLFAPICYSSSDPSCKREEKKANE